MIDHIIILSKLYSENKRIAYLISYNIGDSIEKYNLKKNLQSIQSYEWSTYNIITDSLDKKSIPKQDPFYEGVEFYYDFEEFKKELAKDKDLSVVDVAKYIVSYLHQMKISISHTKLQKLVYLCYRDYLISTQQKLFQEKIEAWKFGPVVAKLYNTIKKAGIKISDDGYFEEEQGIVINNKSYILQQRIIYSEYGMEKSSSIDLTLEKYKDFSAYELVKLTHEKNTPWSMVYNKSNIIDDETILKYAHNER